YLAKSRLPNPLHSPAPLINAQTLYQCGLDANWQNIHMHETWLVCIHKERDQCCGTHGPKILEYLRSELKINETEKDFFNFKRGSVNVLGCSHLGGHKYAGIMLHYPSGHWFGDVRERSDVNKIVNSMKNGLIPVEFWRGRNAGNISQADDNFYSTEMVVDADDIIVQVVENNLLKELKGRKGDRLFELLKRHDIDIDCTCGGNLECATCHVYIESPEHNDEIDMLEYAQGYTNKSRLSCQIKLEKQHERLKIKIPK
ncbi:ferredoxin, partial [Rozella allomycis CSF55]